MKRIFLAFIFILAIIFLATGVLSTPTGGTLTLISNETTSFVAATSLPAIAGNITEIGITAYTATSAWQGYYGNVSGTIQLTDSGSNPMYNWSLANPEGEVYASVNSSVNWSQTSCWDMTTNSDSLEGTYGIELPDADGINETFTLNDHDQFYVNSILISADSCNSTRIFGNNGVQTDQQFEEVILEGGSGEIIFAALIEKASVQGFDGADHDFEMIVLEDGHGADTSTTPYYFYVEIE